MPHVSLAARTVALVCVLAGASAMTQAHHSFAAIYDQTKPIRVQGTVESLEWKNPHVTLTVVAREADGAETRWAFEMGAPRVLTTQFGWTPDIVKIGDRIVVEGARARDGGPHGAAQVVTTNTGLRLRAVRSFR